MKKIIFIMVCILSLIYVKAQPVISYLIPDIGAPGMSTYFELIGPFDPNNPSNSNGNFGSDGFKINDPGQPLRVRCLNPSDEWKVTFSHTIVSWEGRMISVQVFVSEKLNPNSPDWNALNSEFRIPIVVETISGVSNVDTFYIVQPWHLGDIISNTERVLGQGTLGKRSRRGAMIVDSILFPSNSTYTVSVNDCDPRTSGNQAYLPFILLSKGKISGLTPNTAATIDVSGQKAANGHAGNGGPGGGGGGGHFCDFSASREGDNGGDGFVSGGKGGYNRGFLGADLKSYGQGTGANGFSLNGVYPPPNPTSNYEASGGATGHPFGLSGTYAGDGNLGNSEGGFGGGSGFRQKKNGGSGGYATKGFNSNSDGSTFSVSGGKVNGNISVVPIAGGSGGGSGNPNGADVCSGSGGGGGGAIKIYAPYVDNVKLLSNGANGNDGLNNDIKETRGGSGSGGFTGICGKLPVNLLTLECEGGKDKDNDMSGGAGRMRYDLPGWTTAIIDDPPNASKFRGPTTDSSTFVKRNYTLKGSRGDNKNILLFLKPESSGWQQININTYNSNNWQIDLDLSGAAYGKNFCSDSLFYLVAYQEENQTNNIALHVSDPSYVMSQAGTNIFKIIPDIQGDDNIQMHIDYCDGSESDTAKIEIRNAGGPTLNLDLSSSYFDAPANGTDFNGFKVIDPIPAGTLSLQSCESKTITITYTAQTEEKGLINSTLFIPHNDMDKNRNNPWEVLCTVVIDSFAVKSEDLNGNSLTEINVLELGKICLGDSVVKNFMIKNLSSYDINLLDFEFSNDSDKFSGGTVSSKLIKKGDQNQAFIKFKDPASLQNYKTRVFIKPIECQFAIDSFDVVVDVVENDINFEQISIKVDTVKFGIVKIGASSTAQVDILNYGRAQARISIMPEIIPSTQNEFNLLNVNPSLAMTLDSLKGSKLIANLEFTPTIEGPHSATLSIVSDDISSPLSCPGSAYIILFGEGVRSEITAYPVNFGLVANCEAIKVDSIKVKNSGSVPVGITSDGEIIGSDKQYFQLINPKRSPYILNPNDSVFYLVSLDPSIPFTGSKSATFQLQSDDVINPLITTKIVADIDSVYIKVNPTVISFGAVPVPQTKDSSVVISNEGKFDVRIERVDISDNLVTTSPDISGILPSGSTRDLNIHVNFTEFRDVDAEIRIILSEPCDDTLIVNVRGRGLEGQWIYDTDLDFGSIAFCENSSRTFTITNVGDPVIQVTEMRILQQDDWQFFTLLGPEPVNINLNNGDFYKREINFHPDNTTEGLKKATLQTKIFVNAEEKTLTTILTGERASGLLSLPNDVDFAQVIVTTSKNMQLYLVNSGTRIIEIDSILPLTKYPGIFKVTPDQLTNPVILNPGDTLKLSVDFSPLLVQEYLDTLLFSIIQPCEEIRKISLRGVGIPAINSNVWLPFMTVHPAERNLRIPVYMKFENPNENVSDLSVNAVIQFKSSVFIPRGVSENGIIVSNTVDINNYRVLEISASNLSINSSDSILTEIIGDALLGDAASSPLEWRTSIIDLKSNSLLLAPVTPVNGELKLKICEEGGQRLLLEGTATYLQAGPNPANSILNINGHILDKGFHQIELLDIRGEIKSMISLESDRDSDFEYNLNINGLSSGMYYLLLKSPASIKVLPVFIVN